MTKLDKILGKLSKETVENMQTCSSQELKNLIVVSEQAIHESKDQLETNVSYQEAKDNLKFLRSGFNEVKKFQTAKIAYALILLEEKGG